MIYQGKKNCAQLFSRLMLHLKLISESGTTEQSLMSFPYFDGEKAEH